MCPNNGVKKLHCVCAVSAVVMLAIALLGLGAAVPSFAQSATTTLLGTVTDRNGGAVSKAQVTATIVDTNLTRTVPTICRPCNACFTAGAVAV